MKPFQAILLFLLLAQSLAGAPWVGLNHVGPISLTALNCLVNDGWFLGTTKKIGLRIYQNSHSPAGVDPLAAEAIAIASSAGFSIGGYMEICRGINATSQINSVGALVNSLVTYDIATFGKGPRVWVKVEPSVNSECDWAGYSHTDNCNFLTEIINAIQSIPSVTAGVTSTAKIWNDFFGTSCDTMVNSGALVSYAHYNRNGPISSTQTLNDFVPFGGWTVASGKVYKKQIYGNLTISSLCGNPAWHVTTDVSWGPNG